MTEGPGNAYTTTRGLGMTTIQWVRLRRGEKGSAHLMEQVVERIGAFTEQYGGDREGLVTSVWAQYAAKAPAMGLWVGVDSTDPAEIIAHSLAFVQFWNGEPVAWVLQVEIDHAMDRASRVAYHHALDTWIHEYNALGSVKVMRCLLSTHHREAVFARWTGWRRYRTLLDRPIGKG